MMNVFDQLAGEARGSRADELFFVVVALPQLTNTDTANNVEVQQK